MHRPLIFKCSVPKRFQACPKTFMFHISSNVVLYTCSQFKSQKRYIINEISIGSLRIDIYKTRYQTQHPVMFFSKEIRELSHIIFQFRPIEKIKEIFL